MKLLQGIRLSFRLQQIIQNDPVVVRGYRAVKEGDLPSAMNGYLYSILKNTKAEAIKQAREPIKAARKPGDVESEGLGRVIRNLESCVVRNRV